MKTCLDDKMKEIKQLENAIQNQNLNEFDTLKLNDFEKLSIDDMKYLFSGILRILLEQTKQNEENIIQKFYNYEDNMQIISLINHLIENYSMQYKNKHLISDRVKDYVQKHYKEDINVDMIAEVLCLAPSYLSSVFKKEVGENLGHYIQKVRMEKAKQLLAHSYEKVNAISKAVGYWNVSYFCQSFRSIYGISPQQYRMNL